MMLLKFCIGKTIKELEDVIEGIKNDTSEDAWDVISGSTLIGNRYLESIVKAAKALNKHIPPLNYLLIGRTKC